MDRQNIYESIHTFSLINAAQILSIARSQNVSLTALQLQPHPKPRNPDSSSRASIIGCRIQHIIKKASILPSSGARLVTNPQIRGKTGAWEKFQHCLQNRVPRVQVTCPCHWKKSVDALQQGVYGVFLCHNCEIGHALKIPDNRGKILQKPQFTWIIQLLPSGTSSKEQRLNSRKRTVLYRVPRREDWLKIALENHSPLW